jgi:hypothetical protein
MQAIHHPSVTANIIDENGSLNQFYSLTEVLSKTRYVKFVGKNDEADNIEWRFKYRGREIILQYNIYNGVSLFPQDRKDAETAVKLLNKLKTKRA